MHARNNCKQELMLHMSCSKAHCAGLKSGCITLYECNDLRLQARPALLEWGHHVLCNTMDVQQLLSFGYSLMFGLESTATPADM